MDDKFDLTRQIKALETMKCDLLSSVSSLIRTLTLGVDDNVNRDDLISDIVILCYLLSAKTGTPPNELETKILNKLRLYIVKDSNIYDKNDLLELMKSLENSRYGD